MRTLLGTMAVAIALSVSAGQAAQAPDPAATIEVNSAVGMALLQALSGKSEVAQEEHIQLAQVRRRRGGVRRGRRGVRRGVRRRRGFGGRRASRRRWRRRRNRNAAIGIGALVTGIIASEVARENRRDCRRWARRCDRGNWRACRRYDNNC